MDDILVMHSNMGGIPSRNLPTGFIDKLPIGLLIMGPMYDEAKIYQLGSYVEKKLNLNLEVGGNNEL